MRTQRGRRWHGALGGGEARRKRRRRRRHHGNMLMQADAKHDGMCLLKRKQRRPKHSGHVRAAAEARAAIHGILELRGGRCGRRRADLRERGAHARSPTGIARTARHGGGSAVGGDAAASADTSGGAVSLAIIAICHARVRARARSRCRPATTAQCSAQSDVACDEAPDGLLALERAGELMGGDAASDERVLELCLVAYLWSCAKDEDHVERTQARLRCRLILHFWLAQRANNGQTQVVGVCGQ